MAEVKLSAEQELALRILVKELVKRELEGLDEHIDRRIEAALKQQVRDRRTGGRNLEYK